MTQQEIENKIYELEQWIRDMDYTKQRANIMKKIIKLRSKLKIHN